ncbi:MAG: DUF4433 domain-containing protein, partial [Cyclobacteriaceae bacterium]
SIMLFNIITGYYHPVVPKRNKSEILVVRCLIEKLSELNQWFFTDGQANDMVSSHFNDLSMLHSLDWKSIQSSDFSKADGDFDRPRRYQAEFLVHERVPVDCIESLNVYNEEAAQYAEGIIEQKFSKLVINIQPNYFFV